MPTVQTQVDPGLKCHLLWTGQELCSINWASLYFPLTAPQICSELEREGPWGSVISPLTFKHEFSLIFVSSVVTVGFEGAAGGRPPRLETEPHSPVIWRSQTVVSVANEKNNFPGRTLRSGINRGLKGREICVDTVTEGAMGGRAVESGHKFNP